MSKWWELCWWFGMALAASAVMVIALALFRDRSRGRRRCPGCWYDMSGVAGMMCPECGRTQKKEKRFFQTRRRWRRAVLGMAILILGVGTAVGRGVYTGELICRMPTPALRVLLAAFDPSPTELLSRWRVVRRGRRSGAWDRLLLAHACSLELQKAMTPPAEGGFGLAMGAISDLDGAAKIVVPDIERALRSRDQEIQSFGVMAYASLQEDDLRDPSLLLTAFESTCPTVVRLQALSMLRSPSVKKAQMLAACRRVAEDDRDDRVRFEAAAVQLLEDPAGAATIHAIIANAEHNGEPRMRQLAARVLGWYARSREAAELPAWASESVVSRAPYSARDGRFPLASPNEDAVAALGRLLLNPDAGVRRCAADVIAGLDERAARFGGLLRERIAAEPVPEVRRGMKNAYVNVSGYRDPSPSDIVANLESSGAADREKGVEMLLAVSGDRKLEIVRAALDSSPWSDVRRGAVWALLSEQCTISVWQICVSAIRDQDAGVRDMAAIVLRLGAPESELAKDSLEQLADDPDVQVSDAAARQLSILRADLHK